ncbi:TIGR03619 family F420-dependent LLM class oxidoreductase [Microbacterium aurantiacum]|uniref:TIGR03619 family F420-dependent LLM class oxidoreductase n=1 Tax=Microbacterium aurantiacum TaxID=162393 RepID=A0ABT8FVM1_9MICO|nr:TIGR03619 family F420-dependent LLM class oxidoreductase [Microbacterium aurantiacum]MDN4465362.1 TIGR03619 family F420-dependent LLM class oxidoreductase [Microbacterium aurantiacum]
MKICINFPMRASKHYVKWAEGGRFGDVAVAVEKNGFDGIAVSEHPYPHREWLSTGGHHAFDPFAALAAWGAVTERVALISALVVAGYRNPYITAKAATTVDLASGGRMILGLGAGYLESEFAVVGADFARRGPLFDEAIGAMRASWRGEDFDGPSFPSYGHEALPAPVQAGGPPIWVGGNSRAARRRAIELADGWTPIAQDAAMAAITRTPPLTTHAELAAQIDEVAARRAATGGSPLDVSFTPFEAPRLRAGMSEYGRALKDALPGYAEAGVTWLVVEPLSRTLVDFRDDLRILAEELAT